VSSATINLSVATQRAIPQVSIHFIIVIVRKRWINPRIKPKYGLRKLLWPGLETDELITLCLWKT